MPNRPVYRLFGIAAPHFAPQQALTASTLKAWGPRGQLGECGLLLWGVYSVGGRCVDEAVARRGSRLPNHQLSLNNVFRSLM